MRNNNKGFSLVELMVVCAVGAALTAAVVLSLNTVFNTEAKQCGEMIQNVLNQSKTTTMGKQRIELEFYKDSSDGNYYYRVIENGAEKQFEKIGRASIEITYSLEEDYSEVKTLNESNPIVVEFDRSSGAVKANADGKYCSRIWVKKGATEKIITIYKETGKVVCE